MADKIYTAFIVIFAVIAVFLLLRAGRMTAGFWVAVVLAAAALTQLLRLWPLVPANVVTGTLLGVFLSVIILSALGLRRASEVQESARGTFLSGSELHDTLFVLIHGFRGGPESWRDVIPELQQRGDVLRLDYPANALSNAHPVKVATEMSGIIQKFHGRYRDVVVIGHSAGALLARQTYLTGTQIAADSWVRKTRRLVLMAGMNRGWDVTGKRPMDMSVGHRVVLWTGAWLGRLTNTGKFILGTEMGSPFVSNLRMEWMRWFRKTHVDDQPVVVQLLGDIDNMVSDDDNKDLRSAMTSKFYWLRVRGTGHLNILDFKDRSGMAEGYAGVGEYRKAKFALAIDGAPDQLAAVSEEQRAGTDEKITHLVFVLHGIRDLGEWSASLEQELRAHFPGTPASNIAIVSPRYGYFSMGSFIMQPNRQKYVRWLMDQYTEYLARYPNATTIHFLAHSNGTYLLASAFERYHSLRADHVAFAGSVVRRDYNWAELMQPRAGQSEPQVQRVRNYVASDDLVVGLFPRFFEFAGLRWLNNDVGSAGFNGFDAKGVETVMISGGHSGFLSHVPEISRFLLAGQAAVAPQAAPPAPGGWKYWFARYGILAVPVSLYMVVVFLVLKRL
jgi:pimeloyl-ACP methyl ester carboxylesterase